MKTNLTTKSIISVTLLSIILVFSLLALPEKNEEKEVKTSENLEKQYADFLNNHPFRKTMKMSKKERQSIGLPPNKYYEQEWLYTSDPTLLRPAPEKVFELQKQLVANPSMRTPPGSGVNDWVERGPDNVGGRTHTLMFAPGSTTKVFAGGVSGGLWVNNDITSSSSQWQQVSGVPGNMAVMCMTVDPNDSNTMYIGTGEVYTWGAVNGNGVYKSTDGGVNWTLIYSGGTSATDKITYVQDIIAWNNPTTNQTEIFFGADSMAYTEEVISTSGGSGWNWLGSNTIGLYRSTDGTNFSRLTGTLYESSTGNYYAPNDFDIGADGKLWMGTKYSYFTGEGGGVVFSNDGTGWTNVRDLGTNGRVELACSQQTANKIYVLAEDRVNTTNPAKIYRTTNGFSTAPTLMAYPNDADTGITAADFTRGQSFYDLMIGVDPNNDATLYVGGIDLFKSINSGSSWSQFTHWYGGFGYQEVHADQHGIAFANSNRIVFGNDGGVYYTNNGGTNTSARNNGYNVTQFYKAAINQPTSTTKLLAGAQDNGSQLINGATAGINSSVEVTGGDGCWAFIDQDNEYMVSSYVYNNYRYITYGGTYLGDFPSATNDGDFVNQCGLDSDTNILLSNGTSGTTYRIYRWAIDPSGPSIAKTTLSNTVLNTIPTFFVASPYTSDRWLVGTALGKIIRMNSVSGTPTWTDISIPGQIGAVSDIRYGQSEDEIMVTFHNYGVTSIWYTTNGSSGSPTWVSKEGDLPDMPVKCILQNPLTPNEVIVGTELGVWQTSNWSDANPNWTQSSNGMSDVKVLSFDYRSADNTIVAATFGRGMFTGTFEGTPVPVTCTNTISSLPYSESYEAGLGFWSQASGDDGDWIEYTGSTPSSGTGPSSASDGSTYLYIEASSNGTPGEIGANASAVLDGPCLDLATLSNVQFQFDYHTYGANIGSITIQASIYENTWFDLFTTPGVSTDAWVTENIDLSSYTDIIKLRIVGLTGNGFASDLAIDNIHVLEGCPSATTYNGTWSPSSPSINTAVTINSNYNTTTNGGSFEACTLTVSNNSTLTISAGDYVRVNGNIVVDAGSSLIVEHQGSLVQVDDDATVTNNGTINVNLTTPNLASRDFMILGSPMSLDQRTGVWNTAFLVLDHTTANFSPNTAVATAFPGSENFADDNYDNWQAYTGSVNVGEGYIVRPQTGYGQPGGIFNYTYNQGTLNNGIVNFNVIYNTPGPTAADNRNASPNILANPYASAISADDFINANAMVNEVYFWEHLTPPNPSYPGAGSMNFSMQDISMYNLLGGTKAANDPGTSTQPNGVISTGQGFAIKATSAGTAVFNNSMRLTNGNSTLRQKDDNRDRIWISIETVDYDLQSTALIGFTSSTTKELDLGYDSRCLATVLALYSHLEDGSEQLGIQSREAFSNGVKVPVGFSTQITGKQDYKFSISNIEGSDILGATVYLFDREKNSIVNLSNSAYHFSAEEGNHNGRFMLLFSKSSFREVSLGLTNNINEDVIIYPNPTKGDLNISVPNSEIKQITVFDLQGRIVAKEYFSQSSVSMKLSSLNASVYFIQVETENGTITKRIVKK